MPTNDSRNILSSFHSETGQVMSTRPTSFAVILKMIPIGLAENYL